MTRQRSVFAGSTDYTGVPLSDIVEHLKSWIETTADSIAQLETLKGEVLESADRVTSVQALEMYIDYFIGLFARYQSDFARLVAELPFGVTSGHVETVGQLARSAAREEARTVSFKRQEIAVPLPDESMRGTLDEIYSVTRGTLLDYADLDNVEGRLRALIGTPRIGEPGPTAIEALELKPNVFGVGLNLNYALPRLLEWWRSRKKPEA